jgi:hypothetical protein
MPSASKLVPSLNVRADASPRRAVYATVPLTAQTIISVSIAFHRISKYSPRAKIRTHPNTTIIRSRLKSSDAMTMRCAGDTKHATISMGTTAYRRGSSTIPSPASTSTVSASGWSVVWPYQSRFVKRLSSIVPRR